MQKKVIHMVTVSQSIGLMRGQLNYLKEKGYDVIVVSSDGERLENINITEGVRGKSIHMSRTITPFKDIVSLFKIIIFFLNEKPDIVNAGTPKAGLLGMIAAWITGVPFKVYTNRGLPFERNSGIKRQILKLTEKISCFCADKIICISPSIKQVLIKNNLTNEDKTIVIGMGSSNGSDLTRFEYTKQISKRVNQIKQNYNLDNKFVIGNIGRINNFKGIIELVASFKVLQEKYDNIRLLLVGNIEEKDKVDDGTKNEIFTNPDIIYLGYQQNPVPYFYVMDIFAFPTYMEGFGNTSIEAQATGTPVVVTNVTGAVDTIVDKETGILIEKQNVEELTAAIEYFINNREEINIMGEKGKKRVYDNFSNEIIWKGIYDLYRENI